MLLRLVVAILLVSTTIEANQYNSSSKAEIENNIWEEVKKELIELRKIMDEKETEMRRELKETKRELALSVKESLRDLPYVMFCTYQSYWNLNSTIAHNCLHLQLQQCRTSR